MPAVSDGLAKGFFRLVRRTPWPVTAVLAAVAGLLVLRLVLGALAWLVAVLALAAATFFLAWPEWEMLRGRGDDRPLVTRLRGHRWQRVPTPFGRPLPRAAAYVLLAIGWWWVLG
ncbi:MAG: hypothetical protein AAF790_11350 [Planctomycetota bacterium]